MNHGQIFEAVTLICFGIAWPLADWRMLRNTRAEGSGMVPTAIILAGYLCGGIGKLVTGSHTGHAIGWPVPVFWLYAANASSVGLNLALQWRYRRVDWQPVSSAQTEKKTGSSRSRSFRFD